MHIPVQTALDVLVRKPATLLSKSHAHSLMAPIEDRNGDEWSPATKVIKNAFSISW